MVEHSAVETQRSLSMSNNKIKKNVKESLVLKSTWGNNDNVAILNVWYAIYNLERKMGKR